MAATNPASPVHHPKSAHIPNSYLNPLTFIISILAFRFCVTSAALLQLSAPSPPLPLPILLSAPPAALPKLDKGGLEAAADRVGLGPPDELVGPADRGGEVSLLLNPTPLSYAFSLPSDSVGLVT